MTLLANIMSVEKRKTISSKKKSRVLQSNVPVNRQQKRKNCCANTALVHKYVPLFMFVQGRIWTGHVRVRFSALWKTFFLLSTFFAVTHTVKINDINLLCYSMDMLIIVLVSMKS